MEKSKSDKRVSSMDEVDDGNERCFKVRANENFGGG